MGAGRSRAGPIDGDSLSGDLQRAGVGMIGAGDDPDERRFAGAVLADECMHLAGRQIERDAPERVHAAEGLVDAVSREDSHVTPPSRGAVTPLRTKRRCGVGSTPL